MSGLEHELQLAIQLARQAGELVQAIRSRSYQVKQKDNDEGPVTEADIAASNFLVQSLTAAFPQDLIISEEEAPAVKPAPEQRVWFIDPIDGTKAFINNSNEWSVMMGLSIQGRPKLGIVYQPDLDKLYYATAGEGSYLQTKEKLIPLRVRTVTQLPDAVLIQSGSHYSQEVEALAKRLGISKCRKQSSVGLKLGSIAEGTADIYFNFSGRCHLWDLCGPEIILLEAGGIVAHDHGQPLLYTSLATTRIETSFVAMAHGLFEKVHGLIK